MKTSFQELPDDRGEEQKVGSVHILTLKKQSHFQKQQNLSNVKCSSPDTLTTPKQVTLLTEKKKTKKQ